MPDKPSHSIADSLKELATQRGKLLTEDEYRSFRSSLLEQLANPRKSEWFVVVPAVVAVIAGQISVVIGVVRWEADIETAVLWFVAGAVVGGFGAYLAVGNILACRAEIRRSPSTRLSELHELYTAKLIEKEEYESIKSKIGSPRIENGL